MILRSKIVTKAREFIGTRYQHLGRLKHHGVDCLGLVLMTCEELGLRDAAGERITGADYHDYPEFPEDGFIHREFVRRAIWKPLTDIAPGDFVTLRFLGFVCHCGVIGCNGQGLTLIHCYRTVGKVAEHRFAESWRRRVNGVFTLPGVEK